MQGRFINTGVLGVTILLAMLLAVVGCEEEEVYTVSQEEEIERWVTDSDDGRELFGAVDLEDSWTFSPPGSDTIYTAILMSRSRSVDATTSGPRDFGIGSYYIAFATVMEQAVGILRKQADGRTVETQFRWYLERVGFFVKLGDNRQPFSGWVLCGYYGGPVVNSFDITALTGEIIDNHTHGVLVGDSTYRDELYAFKDVDEVEILAKGSQLVFDGCPNCVLFVNYESPSGFTTVNVTDVETDSLCFCDTLQTPTTTDRFWNLLYVTSMCMSDDSVLVVEHSFIPYKLGQ